ncbi:MAG: alpha/beta fold hydrolase [Pyrinomonadaceae bacterium]
MNINFTFYGHGDAVLLLHCFPLSGTMWNSLSADLSAKGFFVIIPDAPGFGASGFEKEWSIDAFATECVQLLDAQNIETAHVCGLSLGGYASLSIYRQFRSRVRSLILCDTNANAEPTENLPNRFELIDKLNANGASVLAEKMLPNLVSENTRRENPLLYENLKQGFEEVDAQAAIAGLNAIIDRADHSAMLETILVKTLFIFGANDMVTPIQTARNMADSTPNSELNLIADVGHLSALEAPQEFNNKVLQFLESVD